MNAFFLTQTSSLPMFYELGEVLSQRAAVQQAGFYVAGHRYFEDFRRQQPAIEQQLLVREWEIVQRGRVRRPDMGRLRDYEAHLGDPTLWGPIIGDRRLSMGRHCTLRQDYAPRFTHEQMLGIIEEGLITLEKAFDTLQPQAVFSFICVTFGEYLAYLLARARGIPYLSLRSTRIENFVTFAPTIFEPSEDLIAEYRRRYGAGVDDGLTAEARRYLADSRAGILRYEGVVPVSRNAMQGKPASERPLARLGSLARAEYDHWFRGGRDDNQVTAPSTTLLYARLLNPARARRVNRVLGPGYVAVGDLPSRDYVFYPMHHEPEMSLSVQSRSYLNQVEVVRNIAQSLPVGWQVLVKEHPASMGRRPVSYYQKLLAIPGVRFVDPGVNSREIVTHARMVITISGSIGFEAVVRGKPVICFGHASYDLLPDSIVRRVTAFDDLAGHVRDFATTGYRPDEPALLAYVGGAMAISERVNLYSNLLRRQGVHVPHSAGADGRTDMDRLADLAVRYLQPRGVAR